MFTEYTFVLSSLVFQVFGSLLLALEGFGQEWVDKTCVKIGWFSNSVRSSYLKSIIAILVILAPFYVVSRSENKVIFSLLLPIALLVVLLSALIDDGGKFRFAVPKLVESKKITPIGFLMLLIGYLLQLVQLLYQINKQL